MTQGEIRAEQVGVSLKEYFESKFTAVRENVTLATRELNRRLEELNKLRGEVTADRAQFVTRELHDKLEDDVHRVETRLAALETRVITIISATGVLFTLIQLAIYYFLHK
jgi:hypothetical protein